MEGFLQSFVRMHDEDFMRTAFANLKCDETCSQLHAGDCNLKALIQFAMGVKSVMKMYLLVHIIPLLLFKLKRVKKNPKAELTKTMKGLINSLLFAGCASMIVRRVICLLTKFYGFNWTICRFPAAIAGVSILFESPSRQIEISLYCIAKGWETAYFMLKRRNYPIDMPCGNSIINGVALAALGFVFMSSPQVFRETYRKMFGLIFKDI